MYSVRRIRCDGKRPACDRCTSTGRSCEGFPIDARPDTQSGPERPRSAPLTLLAPRLLPDTCGPDLRGLKYFQLVVAGQVGGYLEDGFWSRVVMQLAYLSSPVRQITIALALLHEGLAGTGTGGPANHFGTVPEATSVQTYRCAVQQLRSHLKTEGWARLEVTLVACILCVGFEWLRGHAEGALTHLRAGLQIIDEWQKSRIEGKICSPSEQIIEDSLLPFFARLALQAATLYSVEVSILLNLVRGGKSFSQSLSTSSRYRCSLRGSATLADYASPPYDDWAVLGYGTR